MVALERAQRTLERRLRNTMAVADLLGRRRVLLELDQRKTFARDVPFLPNVPFEQAIRDLVQRRPVLAIGWQAAQEAYAQGSFALARAASQQVSARVQKQVASALRRGATQQEAEQAILRALRTGGEGFGFTRAYAETVFRTVVSTSYAAGRHQQAQDPDVRQRVLGWRYNAILDPDVRDNHRHNDNLVAHFDDPIWNTHSPPQGYNCRCALEMVPAREIKKRGLADENGNMSATVQPPAGGGPDEGFVVASRPDRQFYP